MVHGDATALRVATSGPGLQASWLIMWRQFGWRAPASLAAGSRELARHASSARSRLHDQQRGLAEGRAAQPHGSAGEDGGFHVSIEKVLRMVSRCDDR